MKIEPKLERTINLFEATLYGIGIILTAGTFTLIGEVYGITGPASWISFLIAAGIAVLTGLSYAELTSIFPKGAAEYNYVKEAFPTRNAFHFIIGWILLFTGFISTATIAFGFAGYFIGLIGANNSTIAMITVAIVLIVFLSVVNFLGIKKSTKLNTIFTLIEVAGIIFIIVIGFLRLGNIGNVNFLEFPAGSNVILAVMNAAALIFFVYIGFEELAEITEETQNPTKNIPRALMFTILITTILYVLFAFSIASFDPATLESSPNPLAVIVSSILDLDLAIIIISIIALFAISNTVLILLIVGSRLIFSLSNIGTFPKIFSKVHRRTHTPWTAIIFTMIISICFLFIGDIEIIAHASVFSILLIFSIVNVSLIYLRKSQPNLKRPFKVKLSIKGVPIFPLIGAITCFILLITFIDLGIWEYFIVLLIQFIIMGIGLSIYALRKHF